MWYKIYHYLFIILLIMNQDRIFDMFNIKIKINTFDNIFGTILWYLGVMLSKTQVSLVIIIWSISINNIRANVCAN